MRIALITPEYPGCGPSYGVGSYVRALAGLLHRAGHQALVLVVGEDGCYRGEGISLPVRCGGSAGLALLRPWLASGWLDRELAGWQPEVVEFANWGGLGALTGTAWPRLVRLSTPVGSIPARGFLRRLTLPVHARWELRTVLRGHVVIANSRAMAAVGRERYGRDADAIIPHAWTGPVREAPAGGTGVLAVGRLEPRKGSDVLLAAWPEVRVRHPQAELHLVGADRLGLDRDALAALGVVMHGVLDDAGLEALRRRCAVQAMPSRAESFGLVALEAWAAGLAVVASDCAGLAETVGDAGELVPVGDARLLAAALARLLDDRERRLELVARGHRRLAEDFAPERWLAATLDAYRLAAQRAGTPGAQA